MEHEQGALCGIYNFRRIGDQFGTGGQPSESQFRMIRDAGYEAVINLALPTSDNALANEGSIVTALGMSYIHVPVDFKKPTRQDFEAFCGILHALSDRRVFVHCAANKRVSVFMLLYRVLDRHVAVAEAQKDLHAIWEPDAVWSRFLEDQLTSER